MDRLREVEQLAQEFLDAMKLSLAANVTETETQITVDLSGADSYLLLERKGAVLEALQLLMGRVAESLPGFDKRLMIDCDGYRRGLETQLVEEARSTAEKVRKSGQAMELAPMNPYERRLVHIALQDEEGISAASSGEGFIKTIVISPA